MHIRRLTPSPTETVENSSFLVSLRPREVQDQILETLRLNDLPLVSIGGALDFQIIQRLLSENSRTRDDLIGLSLLSYRHRENNSIRGAETFLNYILSKLNEKELATLQELLKSEIIDDTILSNLINLIRLSGVSNPLKFMEILESSLTGTLNLRTFMSTLTTTAADSVSKLEVLGTREVSPDILNAINEQEARGLAELSARAGVIENERILDVDHIRQSAIFQQVLFNTGITFGVSGVVWMGYRFGVWESLITMLNSSAPQPLRQNDPSTLGNLQLGLAGLSGFLLKKGLLRR